MSMINFESDVVAVRPWTDEAVERSGFDPRSSYVERFWLGILGPSSTWLLRRLAAGFDASPEGFDMPLAATARALGLGDRGGRHSPFLRTLNRLVQFDVARAGGPAELQVLRKLPVLNRRQVGRLGPELQAEHESWQARRPEVLPVEETRRRSRRLALSLCELGEEPAEVERQLLRWRYPAAVAQDAAAWAAGRHREAAAAAGVA